ncbi:hypothetical protein CFC21_066789 [Triticum aestivum]|uniref:DUF6598 domain-containing protein n=3 Tax=Triticum TaxID=4564 RepID=A0A9R0TTT7_TRITD|nr:hypothetical protein CFC21_066789 [Triticum aestivum]VAI19915.1 unnamed protein product [Triticum turgidum subsp. durum]
MPCRKARLRRRQQRIHVEMESSTVSEPEVGMPAGNKADDDEDDVDDEPVESEEPATPSESDQAAEEAAEEETMAMMMGLGELADEAAEEAANSGAKKNRRCNRSAHDMMVEAREKQGEIPEEANTDPYAYQARGHRQSWDWIFARHYGPFDQTTSIPASCFTGLRRPNNRYACTQEMLQIFWIKVGKIKKPLQWPLQVFGTIAVRDVLDHNHIMVFDRERDNCQTLTKKDRFLTLTGPTRGVVVDVYPTYVEVDLKAKGATESEDMDLSYLVVRSMPCSPSYRAVPSRLSTLELTYIRIYDCVEVAISVKVRKHGFWPGCRGLFTASTASYEDLEIPLLAFEGDRLPVDASGRLELSRRVVCVELQQPEGKLLFSAKALRGSDEKDVRRVRKTFTPKKVGKTKENIKIGSCEMEVTVTWSLLPNCKYDYDSALRRYY